MTNNLEHTGVMGMHWGRRSGGGGSSGGVNLGLHRRAANAGFKDAADLKAHGFNKEAAAVKKGAQEHEKYAKAHEKFQSDLAKLQKSGKGNDTSAVIKLASKYDNSIAKIKKQKVSKFSEQDRAKAQKIVNTAMAGGLALMGMTVLTHSLRSH